MHNLFLGTAKNIMMIWKERDILTKSDFYLIQKRIEVLGTNLLFCNNSLIIHYVY